VNTQPSQKERCARFVHDPRVEIALVALILLSVVLIVIEFGPASEGGPMAWAYWPVRITGDLLTLLFVCELAVRFWLAPHKRGFFRRYWLDILSVIPFLRFFRIFRILRLLRAGVLINRRLEAVSSTLAAGLGLQLTIFMVLGAIVLCGGLAMFFAEGGSGRELSTLGESMWWSFFTLAGGQPAEPLPHTEAGRIVTMLVVLGGITIFAVFTGVVSAFMVQRLKLGMEAREMDLDELSGHVVICGWNRAGQHVVQHLLEESSQRRHAIVAVAEFDELPEAELPPGLRSHVYFQRGDYTRIDVLESVGIRRARRAILLADKTRSRSDQDRDARTVLAALTIEKLNPEILTCAQLLDRNNDVQLQVAGVEDVVVDDEVCGQLIASSVKTEGMIPVFTGILSMKGGSQAFRVTLPEAWDRLPFGEAVQRAKQNHDALLVGVERQMDGKAKTLVNPPAAFQLLPGDQLILLAEQPVKLQ
jgi:voltage-gated potassium channel